MWVYREETVYYDGLEERYQITAAPFYEVGYYAMGFRVVETYDNKDAARQAVHFLNGGVSITQIGGS